MKIYRYLINEILIYSTLFFGALFIALLGNYTGSFLNMAANGYMSLLTVLKLLLFISPNLTLLILPMCVFAGIFTAFKRLSNHNELIILFSCGVTWKRLFAYAAIPIVILTCVTLQLSFIIVPKSLAYFELLSQQASKKSIQYLQPGKFYQLGKNKMVFLDDQKGILLLSSSKNHISLLYAPHYIVQNHFLVMNDGWNDVLSRSTKSIEKLNFKQGEFDFGVYKKNSNLSLSAISTHQLLSMQGIKPQVELRWRLYTGLLPLIILFLVFPFCGNLIHKKTHFDVIFSIVVFVGFCVISSVLKNLLSTGELPHWFGFEMVSFIVCLYSMLWIWIKDGG